MKRFFYVLIFLLVGLTSTAQRLLLKNLTTFDDKRIHFGFTLGINATDFGFAHYQTMAENPNFKPLAGSIDARFANSKVRADISTLTPGFTVGIVSNLRLTESFDLRFLPGMSFAERKLVYNIPIYDNAAESAVSEYYSIKSTFLDFPLLLKYKSRKMNNQRPYIIGGGAIRVDISKSGQEDLVRLKPFDTYLEAGVGWDSYLQFFRLSTELKFSFGMNNILDAGPKETQAQVYSGALSKLSSNIITLCFHFE